MSRWGITLTTILASAGFAAGQPPANSQVFPTVEQSPAVSQPASLVGPRHLWRPLPKDYRVLARGSSPDSPIPQTPPETGEDPWVQNAFGAGRIPSVHQIMSAFNRATPLPPLPPKVELVSAGPQMADQSGRVIRPEYVESPEPAPLQIASPIASTPIQQAPVKIDPVPLGPQPPATVGPVPPPLPRSSRAPAEIPPTPLLPSPSAAAPETLKMPTVIDAIGMAAGNQTITSVFDNLDNHGRFLVTAEGEYLLWFLKGSNPSLPAATAGTIGGSGAIANQLGDTNPAAGPTSGGRFTLGYWQYDNSPWTAQGSVRTFGVEARFFFVGSTSAELNDDTAPTLYRPFYDLNDHVNSGLLVSAPGVANGEINARGQFSMWGAEANVWKNAFYDKPSTTYAVDLMVGLRYLNAASDLDINSMSTFNNVIPAASPYASFAGNRLQVADSFATQNNFFGGQIGIGLKSWLMDTICFEGSFRVALGGTSQEATITGSQVRTLRQRFDNDFRGRLTGLAVEHRHPTQL